MKTAIQWLEEEIGKNNMGSFLKQLIQQAKDMEKEQIENAYWDGGQDIPLSEQRCKQYYNETFKSE
jgi:hypothetical protein